VRKWTKSACTVLAWSITVPLLAAAALIGPAAQANASTASNTSTTPASVPGSITRPAPASAPTATLTAPSHATAPAGGMPRWLEDVLLTAGLLGASAFAAEPAAARARIILAAHERLIVTYSPRDDTVYVLTPPGEDPRAVLRAARLVLPENTYQQLADHLGVPAAWPRE
jgi:hypothetical protein